MMLRGFILGAIASVAVAAPANAVFITKVEIQNSSPTFLQVGELQAFDFSNVNRSLGATATATSVYQNGPATPDLAIDGDTSQNYPNIYHGDSGNGSDILTVAFGSAFDLKTLTIFGRSDCCSDRDSYTFRLFNGATQVREGTLDTTQNQSASVTFASGAVPEPTTWAMMILGFAVVGLGMRRRTASSPKLQIA